MKQKIIIPKINDCWCGKRAVLIDWDDVGAWRVICDNNHTMTRECLTINRAVHRWNNRIIVKINLMKAEKEMKKCKGENCEKINHEDEHSKECLFEHFMAYTGGYREDEATQEKLKKAYFDGYEAGRFEIVTPIFTALGLSEVNLPKLII